MRSVVLCLLLAACGTPGLNVPVDLSDAPAVTPAREVAHEVGALLGADPVKSERALERLTTLDESGRRALSEVAAKIPDEQDPRWLDVLDENHLLPPQAPSVELEYQLWKVSRPEAVRQMKAQGRLVEMARAEPDLLLRRLEQGGRGTDSLAVALGLAGVTKAVPHLLQRYRQARSEEERRVAAEALALLAGEGLRPHVRGSPEQIRHDADRLARWYEGLEAKGG